MKLETKNMLLSSLFCAITVICAQITIPAGTGAVCHSLAVVGVFLCGALLDTKYATLSMIVYILLGVCSLPVFARFTGGIGVLVGPTGGYICAYPFMAFIIALICKDRKRKSFIILFLSMLTSLVVCYFFGSIWLSFYSKISYMAAAVSGVLPFVIFDVIKALLSAYVCGFILRRMKNRA